MPVTFNVEERSEGLIFRVREAGSYGRAALAICFGSVTGYFFVHFATSRPFQILVCFFIACGVAKDAISSLRGTDVELQVGNLDLISRGHAAGGYKSSTISRATVERFEHRKASGGGDGPDLPEGLYAEWSGFGSWPSSQCILPGVSQSQVDVVIEAIYKRFPDTGTLSSNKSRQSDLISLISVP